MTLGDIRNLNPAVAAIGQTKDGVLFVPANSLGDGAPEYCIVTGSVVTNVTTGKQAHFGAALPAPAAWTGRFLMQGCGGTCGDVFDNGPPAPSILHRGYAVWSTDDGHIDSGYDDGTGPITVGSNWAVKDGRPDAEAIADYAHRAVHEVAKTGKLVTSQWYGRRAVQHAYFMGCSDGGREGLQEAAKYPEDFDGIIAGAPLLDLSGTALGGIASQLAQLQDPAAELSNESIDVVSKAILTKCDAADGVKDGLVQNPAACNFEPLQDIPRCDSARHTSQCLTAPQIKVIDILFSSVETSTGRPVVPGFATVSTGMKGGGWGLAMWTVFPTPPIARTGPHPFGKGPAPGGFFWAWPMGHGLIRNFSYPEDREFDAASVLDMKLPARHLTSGRSIGVTIPDAVAARVSSSLQSLSPTDPHQLSGFLSQGRKLLMWHGFADGVLNPYVTVRYFESLAKLSGGYDQLRRNARLFVAPDVAHCGVGGEGPGAIQTLYHRAAGDIPPPQIDARHDLLSALEAWAEQDLAPASIIATKYRDDDPSKEVIRSMPLCPFPAAARYDGVGDVKRAASWTCPESDARLLQVGRFGKHAGR